MNSIPFSKYSLVLSGKRLTLFSALAISLLCLSASCKDKNKPSYCTQNPQNCATVSTAKDFFLFKEGSWWVYEEEMTHERDSMYVNLYTGGTNYQMQIKSARTDYEYFYFPVYSESPNCSQTNPVYGKCVLVKVNKAKPGDFVGEGVSFFVNFKKGDSEYSFNTEYANNQIIVSEIFQGYTLGELSFGQTVKIHELNTYIEGIQPTNHYYSKGIGLVRKELLDSNQVWNLVSYHIEP
jgi:hypothetical protein